MDKNNVFIYKITSPSGRIYIGKTKNIEERIKRYRGVYIKQQPKLYNSLMKYGWEFHTFEIIDGLPDGGENNKLINELEIYWIEHYNSFENGLNCTRGGDGFVGINHSEETKQKISASQMGRKPTKGNTGNKASEETRQKISNRLTGRTLSEETRKKLSEAKKGKKGHPISEETKKKISQTKREKNKEKDAKKNENEF